MKRYTRINNVKNGKILQLNSENSTHNFYLIKRYHIIWLDSKANNS